MREQHRIIDTSFGEVCLKPKEENGEKYCEMYIGDNYDEYVGNVDCDINDEDEIILQQIEEKLYY